MDTIYHILLNQKSSLAIPIVSGTLGSSGAMIPTEAAATLSSLTSTTESLVSELLEVLVTTPNSPSTASATTASATAPPGLSSQDIYNISSHAAILVSSAINALPSRPLDSQDAERGEIYHGNAIFTYNDYHYRIQCETDT